MSIDVDLSVIGRALADESRSSMLTALMTGTAWTVGELASHARVARSTASEHVHHLAASGLVQLRRQGRHTYVALSGPQVAQALETLSLIAPERPAPPSLRGQRYSRELSAGRTCYHHLAGRLGVQLHDHLVTQQVVTAAYEVTDAGRAWFAERSIDIQATRGVPLLRPCLDWTERRNHLAGPLITRLTNRAFSEHWIERGTHPRGVRLTAEGAGQLFG